MSKLRFVFEKTGKARYISHLDLMRTFQRAFMRSGLKIRQTEGFNPHLHVSIALPLSLGCESLCELLDAELLDELPLETLPERLNPYLPEGIRIISVLEARGKTGLIKYVKCSVLLYRDEEGYSAEHCEILSEFLKKEQILVTKKTKRGETVFNLREHMSGVEIRSGTDGTIELIAVLSAREPTVNPSSLVAALRDCEDFPQPGFALCRRLSLFDESMAAFE